MNYFLTKTKLSFYDADPAGIIFFANIFKLAHSAYEDFLQSLNTNEDFFNDPNYILPIIHSEANFYVPIKFHDNLKIQIHVSKLKDSSFELTYQFYSEEDKIHADVKTVHVCTDKKSFTKSTLPVEFKNKLISFSNE